MNRIYIIIKLTVTLLTVALLTAGCGNNSSSSAGNSSIPPAEKPELQNGFPNIDIPAIINDREQMVNNVAQNFWAEFFNPKRLSTIDNRQPNDSSTILSIDTASVNDALARYLMVILPQADLGTAGSSLKKLVKKADTIGISGDRRLLLKIMQLGEYIYYNPNSPYRYEELYLPIVEEMIAAKSLSNIEKIQFEYPLRMLKLNRAGTKANNFQYEELTTQGTMLKGTLYGIKAPFVILFFNNPGCEACEQFLSAISNGSILSKAIESGKVKVLSMYIDENINAWKNYKAKFPNKWVYARDPNMILRDNTIYGIRAIPSVYLLDKNKRVLLKDGGPESIPEIERLLEAI